MPLPESLARFNRRVTNRLVGVFAGRLPGFAVVVHKGRTTGKTYRTPVTAFERDNGYRFALTYGANAQWVRNVLAAGECELETEGRTIKLTNPSVVEDGECRWASIPARWILRLIGANQYLQCTDAGHAGIGDGLTDR